jgi:hypothetical protein
MSRGCDAAGFGARDSRVTINPRRSKARRVGAEVTHERRL